MVPEAGCVSVTLIRSDNYLSDNYFVGPIAQTYDKDSAEKSGAEVLAPTVDFLARLAGNGPALEFAIGTGRVALPLSQRGISISGIELSNDMIDQMCQKDGADDIEIVNGDMCTTKLSGKFKLVYLVYNTIGNVTTQEAQVACFRNASEHLEVGGHFVIEVGVPSLRRLAPGETAVPFDVSADHVGFDEFVDLTEAQLFYSRHYRIRDDGKAETFSLPLRYVWPSELDLMARIADLSLAERWADWDCSPFTSESTSHVSVWVKDA